VKQNQLKNTDNLFYNCFFCNLLAYTAYCHVVMSCLHIVMSVYYLLVDYYVYFVYVCMFATLCGE